MRLATVAPIPTARKSKGGRRNRTHGRPKKFPLPPSSRVREAPHRTLENRKDLSYLRRRAEIETSRPHMPSNRFDSKTDETLAGGFCG